ncbi:hypothetical protein [Actinoplanes sp. GCM10030250]|uniref:hypothetical protein n=1 Tax=Actinoplanes sp. GCM10030250 TaxID=3273376 RepID=UPI0036086783
MSLRDLLEQWNRRDPNRSDTRALIDEASGADAVRALRRQMAERGRPGAVWPDQHRSTTRRGYIQD